MKKYVSGSRDDSKIVNQSLVKNYFFTQYFKNKIIKKLKQWVE